MCNRIGDAGRQIRWRDEPQGAASGHRTVARRKAGVVGGGGRKDCTQNKSHLKGRPSNQPVDAARVAEETSPIGKKRRTKKNEIQANRGSVKKKARKMHGGTGHTINNGKEGKRGGGQLGAKPKKSEEKKHFSKS